MFKQSSITLFRDLMGEPVSIPVIEVDSGTPGPHLLITASIHGDEPISSAAALAFVHELATKPFAGKVTVFSCLNVGGMSNLERGYSYESQSFTGNAPNLNRTFGKKDPSLTARVAETILAAIADRSPDFVIDAHSYSKDSLVHIVVDRPGGTIEKSIVATTVKSSIPYYLEYEAATLAEQALDHALSMQLCLRKIPSITLELGPRRGFSKVEFQRALQAIRNCAVALEVMSGEVVSLFKEQSCELDPSALYQRFPVWIAGDGCGLFYPECKAGDFLKNGAVVGAVRDLYGKLVETITMPEEGVIIVLTDDAYSYPRKQVGVAVKRI
jgi:predicted deacylase